ncbi:MAG: hypothetical protein ACRD8O_20725 [Bryobacteraceae bacterium]
MNLPERGGFLVERVAPGSAAEQALIRGAQRQVRIGNLDIGAGGDLITAIDRQPVRDAQDIARALEGKQAGDLVEVTIFKYGVETFSTVVLTGAAGEPAPTPAAAKQQFAEQQRPGDMFGPPPETASPGYIRSLYHAHFSTRPPVFGIGQLVIGPSGIDYKEAAEAMDPRHVFSLG